MQPVNRFFTIPNVLTLSRIALIPFYLRAALRGDRLSAAALLLLCAVTDLLDGAIARRFHLVSTWGKVLDPCADKLLQLALFASLLRSYPHMLFPLLLLGAKEGISALFSLAAMQKTHTVRSSELPGKLCSTAVILVGLAHLIFPLPQTLSNALLLPVFALMLYSFLFYMCRSLRDISVKNKE